MADHSKKSTDTKTEDNDPVVLDINGSEQHHDLKNNPGEKGDPNHTKKDKSAE